ncbi:MULTISPECIES: DUF1048 domain-containing protein [Kitasatospora]|uniref:DUF1048 domain-containing protein n=1 Tax=Kitasatospora setae (strain ATCC 33774 / DSM 43861 / JCM 3304 / KCC A-0304 / NBRC 14216 / KM-6054) TaxID=452652 RepID=E4N789_KITSK|nr:MULTISPECIES: DUF1048 domain-containing protein [Kitasatospora]BAJ27070.1 hypothetical protein KSE_12370 [Kitasatospora setae KM-6054]
MSDDEKSGLIARVIGPKKRWRAYRARIKELPADYRTAAEAVEKSLMYFVPNDHDSSASLFEDLADLFEQAVANGTSIRELLGDEPVEFVKEFAAAYTDGGYFPTRARKHLTDTIDRLAADAA